MDAVAVKEAVLASCEHPSISAWCASSNLIAVAPRSCASALDGLVQSKLRVTLVSPCSLEDGVCCLETDIKDPDDALIALAWSPPSCRRALLVATRMGQLLAWTQSPHVELDPSPGASTTSASPSVASSSAPPPMSMKAINQWFGHAIAHEGAAPQMTAATTGMDQALRSCVSSLATEVLAPLVYAGWVHAPPTCVWLTASLAQAKIGGGHFEHLFQKDLSASLHGGGGGSGSGGRHWVRPNQLTLAVVARSGALQLYWSVLGRQADRVSWRVCPPLQLCGEPLSAAHVTAAPNGCLRVAAVKVSDPQSVHIFQVSGNPSVQAVVGLPPSLLMVSELLGIISVPQHLTDLAADPAVHPPVHVTAVLLNGALSAGASALVAVQDGRGRSWVCNFAEPYVSPPTLEGASDLMPSGLPEWQLTASHQITEIQDHQAGSPTATADAAPAPAGTSTASLAMTLSLAGSKLAIAVPVGGVLVLDAISLVPLTCVPPAAHTPDGVAEEADGSHHSLAPAHTAVCMSPNSCLVGVLHSRGAATTAADVATPTAVATTCEQTGCKISLYSSLDVPNSSFTAAAAAAADPSPSVLVQLDGLCLAWSMSRQHSSWDVVQRILSNVQQQDGAEGAEAYTVVKALDTLDTLVHSSDYLLRPWFSILADQIKVQILRTVPGPCPTVVCADIVARQISHFIASLSNQAVSMDDHSKLSKVYTEKAAMLAQWEDWVFEYVAFLLVCLKRWSQLRSPPPSTSDEEKGMRLNEAESVASCVPCVRLLADAHFVCKILFFLQLWGARRLKSQAPGGHILLSSLAFFKSVLDLFSACVTDSSTEAKNAVQLAESEARLLSSTRTSFPGPYHLTYSRLSHFGGRTDLASLVVNHEAVLAAMPTCSQEDITRRAQELGLLTYSPSKGAACDVPRQSDLLNDWYSWRRHGVASTSSQLPSEQLQQSARLAPPSTSPAIPDAGRMKKRSWARLHASSLLLGGDAAASGSTALQAAAIESAPVLDGVSGRRRSWDRFITAGPPYGAYWLYETVDGGFITAVPRLAHDASAAAPDKAGSYLSPGTSPTHRAWHCACPISGLPWKRVCGGEPGTLQLPS